MSMEELATFGAGCFWGVESEFRKVPGVIDVEVGYMGGTLSNPSYEDVCSHGTGHAEVAQVMFDPGQVKYDDLVKKFWEIHDPTQYNRQGPDVGDQYRSVIFYHSPEQKEVAEKSREELDNSGKWQDPIVTQIVPAETFWKAEEYHQRYFEKNGIEYCPR